MTEVLSEMLTCGACDQELKPDVRYVTVAKQINEAKCLRFLRERYLRHDKHFAVFPSSFGELLREQQEAGGGDVTVVLPDVTALRFFMPLLQVCLDCLAIQKNMLIVSGSICLNNNAAQWCRTDFFFLLQWHC